MSLPTKLKYLPSHLGVLFMRFLALLPLRVVRAFGLGLGYLLYAVVVPRRKVVLTNLRLCFPQAGDAQHRAWARASFVYFAQTWLDRGWLWHAPRAVVQSRLQITGAVQELSGATPTVIFAPHFYGLDAGATALTLHLPPERACTTIYTSQSDPVVDAWIIEGRKRFGNVRMMNHFDGIKPIVSGLRAGGILYLLPDMNFGPTESLFIPFFGVSAATVPSLSRFARLGRAKIVPVVTRLTPQGYEVRVHEAWQNFPTEDLTQDALRMNHVLEGFVRDMPAQYYWVHKRFKTRPPGEGPVY
jgi:Kdo2-lipid IVA lauroyltransferase/acyltransferase